MSRFPRFFTHRALLLARNDGLIRAPIITENDGFFYNADGTRSQSIRQVFSLRVVDKFQVMKSADPYPVIPAGIAGIQAPGIAKAVGVESLSRTTMSL